MRYPLDWSKPHTLVFNMSNMPVSPVWCTVYHKANVGTCLHTFAHNKLDCVLKLCTDCLTVYDIVIFRS